MKRPQLTRPALLEARDITRLYGPNQGCQDIDFTLHQGEVLGIVGESGSGKSTLLRVLSGLEKPDNGQVIYHRPEPFGTAAVEAKDEFDLYAISEARRRALLRLEWGLVHQNPRDGLRLGVSAGANISERLMALGQRHYGNLRAASQDWMGRVELDPRRIDDAPQTFSGGMQQRVVLARTLASGAEIWLMDEPFAALDELTREALALEVLTLWQRFQTTVLWVTHSIQESVRLADRVLVMSSRPGRILSQHQITLPRPRDDTSANFQQHVRAIREDLSRR